MLLEKSGEIASERRKRLSQNGNDTQLRICLVVKVKYDAKKNNIAQELGIKANWECSNRRWQE